jgi:hypothetical protein
MRRLLVSRVGPWAEFPITYRQEQIRIILDWLRVGESGVIAGMSGSGKSNLLGFLASRPDAAQSHLGDTVADTCFTFLDINRLPNLIGTAFYRAMLQTLYLQRGCLPESLQRNLSDSYQHWNALEDDLLLSDALQNMHRTFCYQGSKRIVWLLDRFDEACRRLDAQFLNSLRALRDAFKGRLCYVVATRHHLSHLRDLAEIDEFYEIVAGNTCWVGPMVERDAQWVARQMAERWQTTFTGEDVARIIFLTGRLPAFLKVAFTLLATRVLGGEDEGDTWEDRLLRRPEIQRQCQQLWDDLTDAQRVTLLGVMASSPLSAIAKTSLGHLQHLGLIVEDEGRLRVFSPLFEAFVEKTKGSPRGRIRLHPETRAIWRGDMQLPVTLTMKEDLLLSYFLEHPDELCTKDALVRAVWPDEVLVEGVRDDRLAQLVKRLREKVELDSTQPCYIVTVHGQGYRFVQPDE